MSSPIRFDGGNGNGNGTGNGDDHRQFRFGRDDDDLTEGEKRVRDAIEGADPQEERPEPFDERREWTETPSRAEADPHYYALHFMAGITAASSRALLNEFQSAPRVARLAAKYPSRLRDLPGVGDRTIRAAANLHPLDMDQVRQRQQEHTSSRSRRPSRAEQMEADPDQPELADVTAGYEGPPAEPPIPKQINGWRYEETDAGGQFMWLAPAAENDPRRAQDGVEVLHAGSTWYVRTLTRRAQGQATLSGIDWRYGNYQSLRFSPSEGAAGMQAAFERARSYMERHDPPGDWPETIGEASLSRSYHQELAEWAASGHWEPIESGPDGYAWRYAEWPDPKGQDVLAVRPVDRRDPDTKWRVWRNADRQAATYSSRLNALRAARIYMAQDAREGGPS